MATKIEKILSLLEDENNVPVISPSYANEDEFEATFEKFENNLFKFSDADGDWWDCDEDEIDYIILEDGTALSTIDIEDD